MLFLVALAALTVFLAVVGLHQNAQINRLRQHGVTVVVTVTKSGAAKSDPEGKMYGLIYLSPSTTSSTTTIAARASERRRFRSAFCSCITPREAITTRRVLCATARSRSARPTPIPASTRSMPST